MAPLVSVMVAVMGEAEHFEETLLSLLRQTLQDFEIIVLDGGICKDVKKMLANYASTDQRIKVFSQKEPGIAAARNEAMKHASGKYCAVSDADDISLPHRLEKQVEFLETHPEVSLCGAWIQTFGAGQSQIRQTPADDALIRCQMMFLCPFAHSTVMWRRADIARTGQKYLLHSSEDYDLWARLLPHIRFANLPEVLVHYRMHEGQRSNLVEETDRNWQYQLDIRLSMIKLLGISPTNAEMVLHQKMSTGRADETWIGEAESWLLKLRAANHECQYFPKIQFDQVIADRWWIVSLRAKSKDFRVWRSINSPLNSEKYRSSPHKMFSLLSFIKQLLGLRIKRLFR